MIDLTFAIMFGLGFVYGLMPFFVISLLALAFCN